MNNGDDADGKQSGEQPLVPQLKQQQQQQQQQWGPPPYYRRVDDDNDDDDTDTKQSRGRHLMATQALRRGQLVFVERPLLAFQSIQNLHVNRYICYHCKAFVNTPANMLQWRCRSSNIGSTGSTNENEPIDTVTETITSTTAATTTTTTTAITVPANEMVIDPYQCISCRNQCGYVYCSIDCEQQCYNQHHQYLCTGQLLSNDHPIVQYKQYAIATNEILLLIAEWWISQHTSSSSRISTNTNMIDSVPQNNTIQSPYTDFIMKPWWDVISSDAVLQDEQEPCAGYINGQSITLRDQLQQVCTTAASLLNAALGYDNDDTDTSINNNSTAPITTDATTTTATTTKNPVQQANATNNTNHVPSVKIPKVTPLDIATRIGAMEQNAMGIRQRSPLCNVITTAGSSSNMLVSDPSFRQEHHEKLICCLQETGFLRDDNTNDHNDDIDTAMHDTNVDVDAMNDENDNAIKENSEYSFNDVALCLSNLYMNEDFSVNDTNTNNQVTTPNDDRIRHEQMYNTDGDDLDILFPPLDGTAMYSIACKMNHSCHPNVILLYRRRCNIGRCYPLVAFIVALRDIAPNEELTISYINANAPYKQRQKELQNYGFICHCNKCQQEKNDAMVDDTDDDEDDDGNSDSDDDFNIDMDDNSNNNNNVSNTNLDDTKNEGETKLQARIEQLDSMVNHSLFGGVPSRCYDPVLNYVVQTTEILLRGTHRNELRLVKNHSMATTSEQIGGSTVIIDLLESCVTGIQNHDYSLCKIVGCDLMTTVLSLGHTIHHETTSQSPTTTTTTTTTWPQTIAFREVYYCSALIACIGYCHDYDFITAKNCIDDAIRLGLPQQCVNDFIHYIDTFADQMKQSSGL